MADNLEFKYKARCPNCHNETGSFSVSEHTDTGYLVGKCFDSECGYSYTIKDRLFGKAQPWTEDDMVTTTTSRRSSSATGSHKLETVPGWLEEAYQNGHTPKESFRGISSDVFEQYGVRICKLRHPETNEVGDAWVFPYTDGRDTGYKVRYEGKVLRQFCADDKYFGKTNRKAVVITTGEFDALSVFMLDSGRYLSVFNLPNDSATSVVGKYHGVLSQFDKVYLAVDKDESGRHAEEKILQKLPDAKVIQLPTGIKDLNQLLVEYGSQASEIWKSAKFSADKQCDFVVDSDTLIEEALNYKDASSISKPTGIPAMDAVMGGWRPGEKTVLLAYPGTGKSTLTRSILYANLEREVHTVVVTTESSEPPAKWLHQLWKIANSFQPTDMRGYMERAVRLISFVKPNHHSVDGICPAVDGALSHAEAERPVILLDNITSVVKVGGSYWDGVSAVVQGLNSVLTKHKDACLVVAAHPTKGEGANKPEKLSITSIDGGQALSQFSDNVLVMYRRGSDEDSVTVLKSVKCRANIQHRDYSELEFNKGNYSFINEPLMEQHDATQTEECRAETVRSGQQARTGDIPEPTISGTDTLTDETSLLESGSKDISRTESGLPLSPGERDGISPGVEGLPVGGQEQQPMSELPVGDESIRSVGSIKLRPTPERSAHSVVTNPETNQRVSQRGGVVHLPRGFQRRSLKERAPAGSFNAALAEELLQRVRQTRDTGSPG